MKYLGRSGIKWGAALGLGLVSAAALAAGQPQPQSVPTAAPQAVPAPAPSQVTAPVAVPSPVSTDSAVPVIAPQLPLDEPVMSWSVADAQQLLGVIKGLDAEGLFPADYEPAALAKAIAAGPGPELDAQASKVFAWVVEDMRDGRTRMDARVQWFVVDPDVDANPTHAVMTRALASHDIAGEIAALAPGHADYAALKAMLARTPAANKAGRALIRANMDRWRWLQRDLGKYYLLTNVPEFQLRLTVDNEVIRSYRTVVGKPGKTATPQLAEMVENVVFNPTWTVPQSIVVGEGLGKALLANPARAVRENYKVTQAKDGTIYVVQQPGDGNSLGRMKIDMPNEHAIYLHDTPSKALFNTAVRAYSHGCIRTERAVELGMTMAILAAGKTPQEVTDIFLSKQYTKVPMIKQFPVYLTYFTMASDITGKMGTFRDIYGRDAPVLAALSAPRKPWDGKRQTTEKVIKLDNPL